MERDPITQAMRDMAAKTIHNIRAKRDQERKAGNKDKADNLNQQSRDILNERREYLRAEELAAIFDVIRDFYWKISDGREEDRYTAISELLDKKNGLIFLLQSEDYELRVLRELNDIISSFLEDYGPNPSNTTVLLFYDLFVSIVYPLIDRLTHFLNKENQPSNGIGLSFINAQAISLSTLRNLSLTGDQKIREETEKILENDALEQERINAEEVNKKIQQAESIKEKLEEMKADMPDYVVVLIRDLLDLRGEEAREAGQDLLESVIKCFDLDPQTTLNAWIVSNESATAMHNFEVNLYSLFEIENARPGIARLLWKEFGILDYGRYPTELLVRQFDEFENINSPYGIVIYPRYDHNGAFNGDRGLLFELTVNVVGNGHLLRVIEVGDRRELARNLIKLDKRYGSNQKISFAIIGGHGEKDGIVFGNESSRIPIEDLTGRGHIKSRNFFNEQPTLILFSCSTGAKGGFAQELSKLWGVKVIAPDKPTHASSIDIKVINNQLDFKVDYGEKETQQQYMEGSRLDK